MTTGADSWQVAGLWGDAAQCENAASGLTRKDKETKKLKLKKRCTFRGVSKFFFFFLLLLRLDKSPFFFWKKRYSPPNFLLGCVSSFFSPPLALHFLNVLEKEKAKLPENKCWFFRIFNASSFPLLPSSNCSSLVEGVPFGFRLRLHSPSSSSSPPTFLWFFSFPACEAGSYCSTSTTYFLLLVLYWCLPLIHSFFLGGYYYRDPPRLCRESSLTCTQDERKAATQEAAATALWERGKNEGWKFPWLLGWGQLYLLHSVFLWMHALPSYPK